MRTYKPDGWVILKLTPVNENVYYKIFGTWRGGDTSGDSWRLSSGSEELPVLSDCGFLWIWQQDSGSFYELPIDEEDGYTFYTGNVLSDIIDSSSAPEVLIERVKLDSIKTP